MVGIFFLSMTSFFLIKIKFRMPSTVVSDCASFWTILCPYWKFRDFVLVADSAMSPKPAID